MIGEAAFDVVHGTAVFPCWVFVTGDGSFVTSG
jgi:hypothetical protein